MIDGISRRGVGWPTQCAGVHRLSPGEEVAGHAANQAILTSVKNGGAPVRTDWGYRRAIDPAVAVNA